MQIRSKHVGALLGLAFGWLILRYGFVAAIFLLAMAVGGWFLGRVLDGETEIGDLLRRRRPEDLD